jgi:hypothetical protein
MATYKQLWDAFARIVEEPFEQRCQVCGIRHRPLDRQPRCDMVTRFNRWKETEARGAPLIVRADDAPAPRIGAN